MVGQPSAVAWVHKDEFDTDAMPFNDTADDGPCADLAHGKIEKNLQLATERNVFLGANK